MAAAAEGLAQRIVAHLEASDRGAVARSEP
jgi:hypothetical protein